MCPSNNISAQLSDRIQRVSQDFLKRKERKIEKMMGPGIRRFPVVEPQEATIIFYNLHHSVQGTDLRLHFSEFDLKSLILDLSPDGTPTGTGSLQLPKFQASHFIEKFYGLHFEGVEVKFTLMNFKKRFSFEESGDQEIIDRGSPSSPSTPKSTPVKMSPLREQRKEHVGKLVRRLATKDLSQDVMTATFSNLTI